MAKNSFGENPPRKKPAENDPPIELTAIDGVYTRPQDATQDTEKPGRRRQRGGGKKTLASDDVETASTAEPEVSNEDLEKEKAEIRARLEVLNNEGNRAARKHVPGPDAEFLKGEERIREIERLQQENAKKHSTSKPAAFSIPTPKAPDTHNFSDTTSIAEGGPSALNTPKPVYEGEPFSRTEAQQKLESLIRKITTVTPVDLPDMKGRKLSAKEMAKESGVQKERDVMFANEKAYLEAYQAYEKKNTWKNRLLHGKDLKTEKQALESLKNRFDQSRLAYSSVVEAAQKTTGPRSLVFEARMQQRFEKLREQGTLPKGPDGKVMDFVSFMEFSESQRREKIGKYVQFREIVRPLAEKKIEARANALNERGFNAFTKGLQFIGKQNAWLEKKCGKIGARAIKALLGAVVITGGAAMFGGLAGAGAATLIGFGAIKFTRALAGSVAGVAAGELVGNAYEQLIGRNAQTKAAGELRHKGHGDTLTYGSLTKLDATRERLGMRAQEVTLQKKKAIIRALTAFGVGAGTAAALSHMDVVHNAAEEAAKIGPGEGKGGGTTLAGNQDASGGAPEAGNALPPLKEVVIHKNEGFNHLFTQMREGGVPGDSAIAKYLSNPESSPTELSQSVKALVEGRSVVMYEGDKLILDDKQNLWFQNAQGAKQLIMENDPNAPGGITVHELKDLRFNAPRVEEGVVTQPGSSAEVVPEHQETPEGVTAKLMRDQVDVVRTEYPNLGKSVSEVGVDSNIESATEGMSAKEAVTGLTNTPETARVNAPEEMSSDDEGMSASEAVAAAGKSAEGLVTNSYGVTADPNIPTVYEWTPPGTTQPYIVAEAASLKGAFEKAVEHARLYPGTKVLFPEEVLNGNGVPEIRMSSVTLDANGNFPVENNVTTSAGGTSRLLERPNPANFTRKLSN